MDSPIILQTKMKMSSSGLPEITFELDLTGCEVELLATGSVFPCCQLGRRPEIGGAVRDVLEFMVG